MNQSIECRKLVKAFRGDGVETHALKQVDLVLEGGKFISLIGPSGSGKSTLLSLMGTLDEPTSGELLHGGQPVSRLNSRQLADFRFETIGFIFQQFHLIITAIIAVS